MQKPMKFHIGMNISNAEKSKDFYRNLFDAEPVKEEPGYVKFELDNPGLVISFIESPKKVQKNFGHLGFRVNSQEELDAKKDKIERILEITLEEENTTCCYARQNKFWVSDPDGYEWEVYHFLEDAKVKGAKDSLATCC